MTYEQTICEEATGCDGAGDYRDYARQMGFDHCKVVDWTSSAGDWCFIVSRDGGEWFLMSQENNWPRFGFTRSIDTDTSFIGSADEALQQVIDEYYNW